ncbi:uncharacterized protein LOC117254924 [Epinephelus lanceolatus]
MRAIIFRREAAPRPLFRSSLAPVVAVAWRVNVVWRAAFVWCSRPVFVTAVEAHKSSLPRAADCLVRGRREWLAGASLCSATGPLWPCVFKAASCEARIRWLFMVAVHAWHPWCWWLTAAV